MLVKNNKNCKKKMKNYGILARNTPKTQHSDKITAFDKNHDFRDFLLSLVIN